MRFENIASLHRSMNIYEGSSAIKTRNFRHSDMKTIHEIREFLFDVFISAKCIGDFIEDSQNVSRRLKLFGIELTSALPDQHNGRFLEKLRPANKLVVQYSWHPYIVCTAHLIMFCPVTATTQIVSR